MNDIKLVRPTAEYKESFLEALAEFQEEGLPWFMDHKISDLKNDFDQFVQSQLTKRSHWIQDTPIDETELWAISNGIYVGRISIRHQLNDSLRIMGGHIGYDTRPSFRGRGIASEMLRLAIPVARSLGLKSVLLTCNDSNIASIKVIEKNGGILSETKPQFEGGPLKRYYWITL